MVVRPHSRESSYRRLACRCNVSGHDSYPGPEAMYEYDLFAVINHEGQIDNGHYTNYARFQDEVCS
jgi:ubiquitin C-terminal hydrolase